MTPYREKRDIFADSQQVTAASSDGLFERQNSPEVVRQGQTRAPEAYRSQASTTTGDRDLSTELFPSVLDAGVELNGPARRQRIVGDLTLAALAAHDRLESRVESDIPTADLVRRSGYKVGSKMLIKIEPWHEKTPNGRKIPGLVFKTFSLQSIAEADAERYQLIETFEDSVLYLFGSRPRVWTAQGIVMNGPAAPEGDEDETAEELVKRLDRDLDYVNRLQQDWHDFYRGTLAIENRARTYISYEDTVTEATLVELTVVRNAQIPSAANVTLTYVVHNREYLNQEYRELVTLPQIADFLDKTQGQRTEEEKLEPSDIERAPVSADELSRRVDDARTEALAANVSASMIVKEADLLDSSILEQKRRELDAENALIVAQAELEKAQADGDDEAFKSASEEIIKQTDIAADAKSLYQMAEERAFEVTTLLDQAIEEEQAAYAKLDALTDMALAAGSSFDRVLTRDDVIRRIKVEDKDEATFTTIDYTQYDDGSVKVEYEVEYENGVTKSGEQRLGTNDSG